MSKRICGDSGLTLLEIIIAMSLSIVVIMILFSALRLGYRSQDKSAEKAEATQKVRIINDRIAWLVRGAYPYSVKDPEAEKIYFKGGSDSIGFVTTSVDPYGKGPEDAAGLKWVSIFVDREGLKVSEKVFFLEDVFEDDGDEAYLLDPDVKGLEIEYLDVPEDEKEGDWVSDWEPEDKDYLPSAVKVKMTFGRGGRTEEMPEMIVAINARKK